MPGSTGWDLVKAIGLSWLVLLLSLPYFYWRLKKYQHDHYRLGQLQTELRLAPGAVYGVALRTLGLALVVPVVFAGLAFLSMGAAAKAGAAAVAIAILMVLLSFAWLILLGGGLWFSIVVLGYLRVRMQNLLWTKTGNRYMRFRSKLMLRSYLGLQLKNYLLLIVTLGLYWPWAAVATRRMQMEAVTLVTRIDIDELVMAARPREGDAAADMGDDLLGFDLGL